MIEQCDSFSDWSTDCARDPVLATSMMLEDMKKAVK